MTSLLFICKTVFFNRSQVCKVRCPSNHLIVSVYRVPQMRGVGRADVLLHFKCPTTKQMRCPVNAYVFFCRAKRSYRPFGPIFTNTPRKLFSFSNSSRWFSARARLFPELPGMSACGWLSAVKRCFKSAPGIWAFASVMRWSKPGRHWKFWPRSADVFLEPSPNRVSPTAQVKPAYGCLQAWKISHAASADTAAVTSTIMINSRKPTISAGRPRAERTS